MADGDISSIDRAVGQASVAPERRSIAQRLRRPLLIAGPLLVVLAGLGFYIAGAGTVSIDNAFVKADVTTLSTDVSGIVAEVAVHENQSVQAGDLLYRLDDAPYRIAVANAEAQLASARNDIEALRATYRQRQQDILQAQVDIDFYAREFRRQSDLARSHVASQMQLDAARHNLANAEQKLASLKQEALGVLANLSGNADIAVEDHPRYQAAKAQLDEAMRNLAHTRVTAPVAGVVSNVDSIQVGEFLQAGTSAFSLVASGHAWVTANPKETDLTYVRPGQKVTVVVDTYPDYVWHGTVAGISPASGAEFAILPPQNASGNWVKVVQRIPLRIALDEPRDAPPLRAGMSATVEIDTGRRPSLFGLIGKATAGTGQPR